MALTFDANYYLSARPDVFNAFVKANGSTGLTWAQFAENHYNTFGRFEGSNPNSVFNTTEYLTANPDVAAAGVNPFQHFLTFGVNEGRSPNASFPTFASFDSATYLSSNPDLAAAGITTKAQAWAHFVVYGEFEGRPGAPVVDNGIAGSTFTLTAGVDTVVGTGNNDTFNAVESATGATVLNALDSIDGGAGVDTLKIVDTAAIDTTALAGLSIKNIEKIEATSTTSATVDSSAFAGVTNLTISAPTDIVATAATTTAVSVVASGVSNTNGTVTVNGGSDVNVNATAANATTDADANAEVVVSGAVGNVNVVYTGKYADGANNALNNIAVTGGKTVNVDVNSGVTAAQITAAATDGTNFTVTQSAVAVTGTAATTAVTVTQDAAVAEVDSVTAGKIGVANGAVTITDGNAATASDTIKTVTLAHFGATSITSTVLDTLNVTGGSAAAVASGAITLTQSGADTSTAATTLAVNSAGGFMGKISGTQADVYTTLNVAAAANTAIADIEMDKVETINASGAGVTTFTALTAAQNAALKSIISSGGGVTIGTELATGVAVTGGAGVETVSVGATTKAINLGAGNDVVTISTETLGAGGSVVGGDGTDTIVANTNSSNIAGLPQFSGFETLRVAGAAAQGAHNGNGFTALEVGALARVASFTNVATGVGLTQLDTMGANLTVTLANATGTNDTFNLTMKSAGAIGNAGETITIAGVENINIKLEDTNTTAHVNTVELVAGAAKAITVTGNAGLVVANAPASVTSFDASGVVLGKVTDTGVTYTSTNTTVAEAVTIKGSNGVDILSGSATANDTITGGAGADTLIYTGGADSLTGGSEADTFDINGLGTKTAFATIVDLTKGDKIDFVGVSTSGTIADGALGAKVTLGGAATLDQYLDAAAGFDGSTNAVAKWFDFGGNTYIVVSNDNNTGANAGFNSGVDTVVKITGVIDLSTQTFATEVLTLA